MPEVDGYAGNNTPSRYGNVGALQPRFHQPGHAAQYSYQHSRDDYPPFSSWPYQGYSSHPDSSIQLQATLDKIMSTQREMGDLIGSLVSRVEKLEESASSKCSSSACSSSPETERKRVSPQLSVSNVKLFNGTECSIIQRLIAQIHESLDENEQFLPNMKLVIMWCCIIRTIWFHQ